MISCVSRRGHEEPSRVWYGMQSSRASDVGSGKMAGTRSHTLPTPGAHLPKANPALRYDIAKHFRPLASPRGIFFRFSAHFVERDRQPQTDSHSHSSCTSTFDGAPFNLKFAPEIAPSHGINSAKRTIFITFDQNRTEPPFLPVSARRWTP